MAADARRRRAGVGFHAVLVGVVVSAAVAVEIAQPAGHRPAGALRLGPGVAVGGLAVAVGSVAGIVALVVLGALLDLRADRPDADRTAHPDEPAGAADVEAADVLQPDRVDLDVVLGRHRRPGLDVRRDVVVDDAHVDRAGDADEPACDAEHEGLDFDAVGRVDVDALVAVRGTLVQAVDDGVAVHHSLGARVDQRHADGARDADEAARTGDHDVQDVLARLRLHDDAMRRRLVNRVGDDAAVDHPGESAAAQRVDLGVLADRRLGILADQHHADRAADADQAAREGTG